MSVAPAKYHCPFAAPETIVLLWAHWAMPNRSMTTPLDSQSLSSPNDQSSPRNINNLTARNGKGNWRVSRLLADLKPKGKEIYVYTAQAVMMLRAPSVGVPLPPVAGAGAHARGGAHTRRRRTQHDKEEKQGRRIARGLKGFFSHSSCSEREFG